MSLTPGVRLPAVKGFLSSPQCPDLPWGPPSLRSSGSGHLHLVPRSRMVELYLYSPIRRNGLMLLPDGVTDGAAKCTYMLQNVQITFQINTCFRIEVISAVTMNNCIFWTVPPSSSLLFASCWFLSWFTFYPWRWKRNIPPKHWLILKELYSGISRKTEHFCTWIFC
jgi:hypothetical protein